MYNICNIYYHSLLHSLLYCNLCLVPDIRAFVRSSEHRTFARSSEHPIIRRAATRATLTRATATSLEPSRHCLAVSCEWIESAVAHCMRQTRPARFFDCRVACSRAAVTRRRGTYAAGEREDESGLKIPPPHGPPHPTPPPCPAHNLQLFLYISQFLSKCYYLLCFTIKNVIVNH